MVIRHTLVVGAESKAVGGSGSSAPKQYTQPSRRSSSSSSSSAPKTAQYDASRGGVTTSDGKFYPTTNPTFTPRGYTRIAPKTTTTPLPTSAGSRVVDSGRRTSTGQPILVPYRETQEFKTAQPLTRTERARALQTGLTNQEINQIVDTRGKQAISQIVNRYEKGQAGYYRDMQRRFTQEQSRRAETPADALRLLQQQRIAPPSDALQRKVISDQEQKDRQEIQKRMDEIRRTPATAKNRAEALSLLSSVTDVSTGLDLEKKILQTKGQYLRTPQGLLHLAYQNYTIKNAKELRRINELVNKYPVNTTVRQGNWIYIYESQPDSLSLKVTSYNLKTGQVRKGERKYTTLNLPFIKNLTSEMKQNNKEMANYFKRLGNDIKNVRIKNLGREALIGINTIYRLLPFEGIRKLVWASAESLSRPLRDNMYKVDIFRRTLTGKKITEKEAEILMTEIKKGQLTFKERLLNLFKQTDKQKELRKQDLKIFQDKDVQWALLVVGLIVGTKLLGAVLSSAKTTFISSKVGATTSRANQAFIKSFPKISRALGKSAIFGTKLSKATYEVARLYFAGSTLKEFIKKPNTENLARALIFGKMGGKVIKNNLRAMTGRSQATVKNLSAGIEFLDKTSKLVNIKINKVEESLKQAKLLKNSKLIRQYQKELIQLNRDLKSMKYMRSKYVTWQRDIKTLKIEDYSKIINSKDLLKFEGDLVRIYHVTDAKSFNDLFGQRITQLIKDKKGLIEYAKKFKKGMVTKPVKKVNLFPVFGRESKIGQIIKPIIKAEKVIIGGAKAMNLQISARFRRSTSDLDGKVKSGAEGIIRKLVNALNKSYPNRFKFMKGGHKGTFAVRDTKSGKNIIELTNLNSVDKSLLKNFDYITSKDGFLIESKYSLLWGKIDSLSKSDRFLRKGLIDVKDFIRLTDNKAKIKDLLRTYKNPKDIMEVLDFSATGLVGKDRKKFKENFFFFSLFKIFQGYGISNIKKKPYLQYLIDGIFGKNKYRVLSMDVKIKALPKSLRNQVILASKGKLTNSQMNKLRIKLVEYLKTDKKAIQLPSRTLALGRGEEEVIGNVGLKLKKLGLQKPFYDKDLEQFIPVLKITNELKKTTIAQKSLLQKLMSLNRKEFRAIMDRYKLKLTNPDILESKAILKAIKINDKVTAKQKDKLFNIVRRYIFKVSKNLRKQAFTFLNKIKTSPQKFKLYYKQIKSIKDVLKTIKAKYKDIVLKLRKKQKTIQKLKPKKLKSIQKQKFKKKPLRFKKKAIRKLKPKKPSKLKKKPFRKKPLKKRPVKKPRRGVKPRVRTPIPARKIKSKKRRTVKKRRVIKPVRRTITRTRKVTRPTQRIRKVKRTTRVTPRRTSIRRISRVTRTPTRTTTRRTPTRIRRTTLRRPPQRPPRPPPPDKPPPPIIDGSKEDSKKLGKSYIVEIKRKSNKPYEPVKNFRLSYKQARALGKYIVDNSILASFRLKPSPKPTNVKFNKKISMSRFRRPKKSSRLKGSDVWVEKSRYRLDTQGEKAGIQAGQILREKRFSGLLKKLKGKQDGIKKKGNKGKTKKKISTKKPNVRRNKQTSKVSTFKKRRNNKGVKGTPVKNKQTRTRKKFINKRKNKRNIKNLSKRYGFKL